MQSQGYKNRRKRAITFWKQVIFDYDKGGLSPTEIAAKHVNPKTKKHYTREYIHEILRDKRETIKKWRLRSYRHQVLKVVTQSRHPQGLDWWAKAKHESVSRASKSGR